MKTPASASSQTRPREVSSELAVFFIRLFPDSKPDSNSPIWTLKESVIEESVAQCQQGDGAAETWAVKNGERVGSLTPVFSILLLPFARNLSCALCSPPP